MVSRFTRIYETQIKKTNNILNKNIDTNIKQYKTHKKKKKKTITFVVVQDKAQLMEGEEFKG